jgi:AcrR family transcriptional regulator
MSPNQLARRLRVLEAVIGLVSEGGIEEMQMRELAERSGVALGTVYRYFSSKDHVVAAALVEWARQLDRNVARRPLPSGTMADRLKALLRQGVRPFRREPNFAALMVRAASSDDPFASECYQELGPIVTGTLGRALPELEPDEREQVLQVVGAVWFAGLNEWVQGRCTVVQVHERLDEACDLLLAWREPPSA